MAPRYGYTKDLSPKEQREMFAYNRKLHRGAAIRRGKARTKSFVKDHGALIAVGTLAIVLLAFKKELKSAIGADSLRLTP